MRYVTNPELHEVILHQVRPRSGDEGPILSEVALELTEQPAEVLDFLRNHIEKGLRDQTAVASKFKGQDLDVVQSISSLLTPGGFVDASQKLARRLFEIAGEDARIPDGTVAFVLYSEQLPEDAAAPDDGEVFAAILKLDPSSQFRSSASTDAEGHRQITFTRVKGVLPSVRERLQKCAFVRPYEDGQDFQLIAVDRQTAGGAVWFVERFLESEPALDAAERVERFYRAVSQVESSLRQSGQNGAARDLIQARDQSLRDGSINVETFVDNRTVLSEGQREALLDAILDDLPDTQFDVDRNRADALLKKAKYAGDHGLRVSVDQDSRDEMMSWTYSEDEDMYTVTIRTRTWRER